MKARKDAKIALSERMRRLLDKNEKVLGVGDVYDFDYPVDLVFRGWQITRRTHRIPHPEEVGQYDPRWVSDIDLMEEIYRWHTDTK